jgi:hypothetical protein
MGGMIAHATLDLQHGRDALQGPAFVGKARGPGAFREQAEELGAWRVRQLARAPRHRLGGEGGLPTLSPRLPPARHGTHRGLHAAGDLVHVQPLRQERHGTASPSCSRLGGSKGSHTAEGITIPLLAQSSIS